jgi:hypothetical protein
MTIDATLLVLGAATYGSRDGAGPGFTYRVLVTAMLGLLIGLTAMAYQLISGHSFTQVLFSGQEALPELVDHAADYSVAVWR